MIYTKWFTGNDDLSDAYSIRRRVFLEEQKISPEDEFDGTDASAIHLVVYESEEAVATGRILISPDNTQFFIGRIAVLKNYRGNKYGDLVVRMLIRRCFDLGADKVLVHAQLRAQGFYEKMGFQAFGDVFVEAGIEHIHMQRCEDVGGCCG